MSTLLNTLYEYALGRPNLTRWLPEDTAEEYGFALRCSGEQSEELLQTLAGAEHTLLERFLKNAQTCHEAEREMLFCQGLAMGLRLGALSVRE